MGAQPHPGEVPPASSFVQPCKKGTLSKIVGRRWLFLPLWKERYCVLDGSKLYYYDNETSKGTNSNCGVIDLENFDVCEEYECKAVQNAFIITTANRGFFDPYHTFAADTLPEVCDWIATIRSKLNPPVQKRTSFIRKSLSRRRKNRHSLEKEIPDPALDIPGKEPLESITKHRAKGPAGRRPPQRKSQMPKPAAVGVQDGGRAEAPVLTARDVLEEEEEEEGQEAPDTTVRDETDRPRPTSALLYQYSSSSDEDDRKEWDENKAGGEAKGQAKDSEPHDEPPSFVVGNVDEVQERLNKLREQLGLHIDDATMQSLLKQLDYCELELQTAVQTVHEVLNEAAAAVLAKTKPAETEQPTPA